MTSATATTVFVDSRDNTLELSEQFLVSNYHVNLPRAAELQQLLRQEQGRLRS